MIRALNFLLLLLAMTAYSCGGSDSSYSDDDEYYSSEEETDEGHEDGTHSATVDYYNPNTGHSATYSVDVEVEDEEVTTIYWPNGGWSDEDHITAGELDDDGNAYVEGEDGQEYNVQIDE
jgi:hypothetical protein